MCFQLQILGHWTRKLLRRVLIGYIFQTQIRDFRCTYLIRYIYDVVCIDWLALINYAAFLPAFFVQGDQKVFGHLKIKIQKATCNVQSVPRQSPGIYWHDGQGQGDTRLTLKPSGNPNYNYIIVVSDWNCLKYLACFCTIIISGKILFDHLVLRVFIRTLQYRRRFVWHKQHRFVWCNFVEGSEMQHVGCFNASEFIVSTSLPDGMLHLSDEQWVGRCNSWVLTVIHFTLWVSAISQTQWKCANCAPTEILLSRAN
jgi:hypothetical protein